VTRRRRKKIKRAAGRMNGNGSYEDATEMPAACSNWNLRTAVAVAALAGLWLGSCTEKPDSGPPRGSPAPATAGLAQEMRPPAIVPQRRHFRQPPQKMARKEPRIDPVELVGLDPSAVGRVLGRPSATRTDAMAMEWTYSTSSCSLNIYFYPDVVTGGLKALKYNIAGKQLKHGCIDFPVLARNDDGVGEER
jgi:hypothetical protein